MFVFVGSRWSYWYFKGWKNRFGFVGGLVWVCYFEKGVGGFLERCFLSKICFVVGGYLWEINEWGKYRIRCGGYLEGRSILLVKSLGLFSDCGMYIFLDFYSFIFWCF